MAKAKTTLRSKKVPVSPYARGIRLRLYPTPAQAQLLQRSMGAARHVWNWALAQCKAALAARERIPTVDALCNRLTRYKAEPEHAWLQAIPVDVLQQTLRDLGLAIAAWRVGKSRFPRWRKRRSPHGIRFTQSDRRPASQRTDTNPRIDVEGRRIRLTNLEWVRWRGSRDRLPTGDIASATVRKVGDAWFVTLPQRNTPAPPPTRPTLDVLGLDLGVRDAVVTSTGHTLPAAKPLRRALARLRRYQRRYARQRDAALVRAGLDPKAPIPKGTRFERPGSQRARRAAREGQAVVVLSNRAVKTEAQVSRLHAKVAAQRTEFQHQVTRTLVDSAKVIVIEDLAVKGLSQALRRAFRRSAADVGLGEIIRQLTYKTTWQGRELVVIDRWFPSSQLCSTPGCDYRNRTLRLRDRTWTCPQCGTQHDRDLNAAKNIEREGRRLLAERTSRSEGNARGEAASTAAGQPAAKPTSMNRELGYRAARQRTPTAHRDGTDAS